MSKGIREHWMNTHVGGESIQKGGGPVHEGCATGEGATSKEKPSAGTTSEVNSTHKGPEKI